LARCGFAFIPGNFYPSLIEKNADFPPPLFGKEWPAPFLFPFLCFSFPLANGKTLSNHFFFFNFCLSRQLVRTQTLFWLQADGWAPFFPLSLPLVPPDDRFICSPFSDYTQLPFPFLHMGRVARMSSLSNAGHFLPFFPLFLSVSNFF